MRSNIWNKIKIIKIIKIYIFNNIKKIEIILLN